MGEPYFMSVGLHVLAERRLLVCAGLLSTVDIFSLGVNKGVNKGVLLFSY